MYEQTHNSEHTLVCLTVARRQYCSAPRSLKALTTSSPGPSRKATTKLMKKETGKQPERVPKIPCRSEDQQKQSADSFLSKESQLHARVRGGSRSVLLTN